jgi:hypothetical protein
VIPNEPIKFSIGFALYWSRIHQLSPSPKLD